MARIDDRHYFDIIYKEIKRHLEDATWSYPAHFAAAEIAERWNKILGIFTIVLGTALAVIVDKRPSAGVWYEWYYDLAIFCISLVVPSLSALITFLKLNEVAANHRYAAQRYKEVVRNCKNWLTDFPDDTQNELAKQLAQKYRNQMIEINKESPQVSPKARKIAKEQLANGTATYEDEVNEFEDNTK